MAIEFILGFQILADIALCFTIIFLIWVANKEIKNRPPAIDKGTVLEFGKLIEASRCSTDDLLQVLNEVKKIGYALDEKEKRLRTLIKETDAESVDQKTGNSNRKKQYADVIKMAGQGLTEKQIADRLDITEGETCLILNLHRKKNEDSVPGNRNP
jgi:hypothetical protein